MEPKVVWISLRHCLACENDPITKKILQYAKNEVTVHEVMQEFSLPRTTASRRLKRLTKLHHLKITRQKKCGRVWLYLYRTVKASKHVIESVNMIPYVVENSAENVHRLTEETRRLNQTVDELLQSHVERSWREANKAQAVSVNTAR